MKYPAPGAAQKHCPLQTSLSLLLAPASYTARCRGAVVTATDADRIALPLEGWSCSVFHTMPATPFDWDEAAPSDNIFLQRAFLEALESAPPEGMDFVYLIFYHQGKPAGIAYGQLLDLRIRKSLEAPLAAQKGIGGRVKSWLAGLGRFQMLVCGNMLLTGAHGFSFRMSGMPESDIALLLDHAFQAAADSFRARGRKVDLVMVKDISPCCKGVSEVLATRGFCDFSFQPDMSLRIDPSWRTMDDYLEAMSSKYRVRARRAFKKKDGIVRRELNTHMTALEAPAMYALYKEVAAHADFNAFELHPDHFTELKNTFPDLFRVFGYYQGEELVGFCTTMRNVDTLEAHFLGFRDALNASHQLYLNMLYDMVGVAIESGSSHIGFARTAMEIKSSIGAEPQHLDCRLRHCGPLSNRLMPFFIRLLEPRATWVQRHPFRREA